MRSKVTNKYVFLVLLLGILGSVQSIVAAPAGSSRSVITMNTSSMVTVNQHEVASADLLKALKKYKISTETPLEVEVPANTPMGVIKELTQRLATAGYKPFFKYPRHADASVEAPKAPTTATPQNKQAGRQ